jgi:hypothetical protein
MCSPHQEGVFRGHARTPNQPERSNLACDPRKACGGGTENSPVPAGKDGCAMVGLHERPARDQITVELFRPVVEEKKACGGEQAPTASCRGLRLRSRSRGTRGEERGADADSGRVAVAVAVAGRRPARVGASLASRLPWSVFPDSLPAVRITPPTRPRIRIGRWYSAVWPETHSGKAGSAPPPHDVTEQWAPEKP